MSFKLFLSIMPLFVLLFLFVGSVGASSEMWSQTYGGEEGDYASSVIETSDGGYALAGWTGSLDISGKTEFWLIKTDAQGIPEFPSWVILPLFFVATLVGVIVKRKAFRPT
jgi:hypothetical protein